MRLHRGRAISKDHRSTSASKSALSSDLAESTNMNLSPPTQMEYCECPALNRCPLHIAQVLNQTAHSPEQHGGRAEERADD